MGQFVGQLAKMHGMKVIGSTGSQQKVDFVVKELGCKPQSHKDAMSVGTLSCYISANDPRMAVGDAKLLI